MMTMNSQLVQKENRGDAKLLAPTTCVVCHKPLNRVKRYKVRITSKPTAFYYYHTGCKDRLMLQEQQSQPQPRLMLNRGNGWWWDPVEQEARYSCHTCHRLVGAAKPGAKCGYCGAVIVQREEHPNETS